MGCACSIVCALVMNPVFAADFIGEGGSYSGDLAVGANWNPSGVPQNNTANFTQSGELTAGSPVTFSAANFTGSALEWTLGDFGVSNVTIQDLTMTGTGSHLLLTNGTLTIDGTSPHVYIGCLQLAVYVAYYIRHTYFVYDFAAMLFAVSYG